MLPVMLDVDAQRFAEGLNRTAPGMRLRLAIHEGKIAVAELQRLRRDMAAATDLDSWRKVHYRDLDSWRRAYIRSCTNASQAIDDLWEQFRWPMDAGRARAWLWVPKALKP